MADDKPEFIPNPPELNGVEDLSLLTYLEMPNVQFNMEYRFNKLPAKECYTCVSTILLAVNPYEWPSATGRVDANIYSQSCIDIYHEAQKTGELKKTPHPYAVASRAYVRMVARKKQQSLLCCGISGAGKSECAKQLIRYLARTSPSAMAGDKAEIENQIVQASIILEAWGNAKTTLNNNSSRFGKFTKLMYKSGAILGTWLETYLLEKSRVIMQGPNERNYHIFYFLFKGLSQGDLDKFELKNPTDFWYLKQGGCTEVAGIDDGALFTELMDSLKLFRFGETDLASIWSLTAGILHCGNIGYKEDDSGCAKVDPAFDASLKKAASLWQIPEDELKKRLETASMEVMKKTIIKDVPPSKYNDNRDAITKALFENSFLFVVERINAELFHVDDDVKKIMFIGILDIFGFENFVINSIEQFCINFTNEKIQGFFNFNIIASEQEEYIKEAVLWKPMKVPDNSDFIAMIEKKKEGMFALLDSACKAPKPAPENFVKEFFKKQGKLKQYLEKSKGPSDTKGKKKKGKKKKSKKNEVWCGFVIHHFCDDVIYTATLFLDKNMDAIHPDTAKMYAKSESSMVQMIGAGTHHKKKKKKKKKAKSVTGLFSSQLINLLKTLNITEPYFCRALKPNWEKSSKIWDEELIEDQLRSGGLIEALRVLKLGYPTRVPYQKIWDMFHDKIKNPMVANLDEMGFAEVVLSIFGVTKNDYELGLTKIFFKPAKAAVLDKIMSSADKPLTEEQIGMITKFVQGKRMRQIVGACKVFLKLSLRIRFERAKNNMAKWGRIIGLISQSVVRHADFAKNAFRIKAAQKIQAHFRARLAKTELVPAIQEKKLAAQQVYSMWRTWEERQKLMQWLIENCESAKKRAEELRSMSPEERGNREAKRLEERKKAAEAAARASMDAAAAEEAEAEEAKRKHEEELEQARLAQERAKIEEDADKIARQKEAEDARKKRIAEEKAKRDKENAEMWKLLHPGDESDDEEEGGDDESGEHGPRKKVNFFSESSSGHLFTIYHDRKNRPPHDRFVKMDYTGDKKPINISWGSGDRSIKWEDIQFVIKGCVTHTMNIWEDDTTHVHDDDHVFSIITKDGSGARHSLDISASDEHSRDIWADGITKLLGMTEEERAKLQSEYQPRAREEEDNDLKLEKTATQLATQKMLFETQTETIFRELNFEGIYGLIGSVIKEEFQNDEFYETTLKKEIPWRNWDGYIRKEIVNYLVRHEVTDQETADKHETMVANARSRGEQPEKVAEPQSDDCLLM